MRTPVSLGMGCGLGSLLALIVIGCGERDQSQLSSRQVVRTSIPVAVAVGPADGGRAILVEFGSLLCEPSRRWAATVLPEVQGEYGTDLAHWYVDITPPGDAAVTAGIAACLSGTTPLGTARAWLASNALGRVPEEIAEAAMNRFGVDSTELLACARSQGWDLARARVRLAADLGVPGTPTLIVGRRDQRGNVVGWVFLGYSSPDTLRPYIEAVRAIRPRRRPRGPYT